MSSNTNRIALPFKDMWLSILTYAAFAKAAAPLFRGHPPRLLSSRQMRRAAA